MASWTSLFSDKVSFYLLNVPLSPCSFADMCFRVSRIAQRLHLLKAQGQRQILLGNLPRKPNLRTSQTGPGSGDWTSVSGKYLIS
jgi:hypothetical protein